jgi:hypothetical protein
MHHLALRLLQREREAEGEKLAVLRCAVMEG